MAFCIAGADAGVQINGADAPLVRQNNNEGGGAQKDVVIRIAGNGVHSAPGLQIEALAADL